MAEESSTFFRAASPACVDQDFIEIAQIQLSDPIHRAPLQIAQTKLPK